LTDVITIKQAIVDAVYDANPTRNVSNVNRRIIKLGEEYGEASEAYLNVTSAGNGKGKTWADVREELADVLIVALDVVLTPMSDDENLSDIQTELDHEITIMATDDVDLETRMLRLQDYIGRLAGARRHPDVLGRQRRIAIYTVLNAFEAALHPTPDQEDLKPSNVAEALYAEIIRKLAKWTNNRDTGKVATDAE